MIRCIGQSGFELSTTAAMGLIILAYRTINNYLADCMRLGFSAYKGNRIRMDFEFGCCMRTTNFVW